MAYVKFTKMVKYGHDTLKVKVTATERTNWGTVDGIKSGVVTEEVKVELFSPSNDFLYLYDTNTDILDANRYITVTKEAIDEFMFRQFKNEAAVKFKEWDGNFESI
jgi:hypothetical protein